nr:MAG TPA: hypothetical protein [Caudoviricetes sp.]
MKSKLDTQERVCLVHGGSPTHADETGYKSSYERKDEE